MCLTWYNFMCFTLDNWHVTCVTCVLDMVKVCSQWCRVWRQWWCPQSALKTLCACHSKVCPKCGPHPALSANSQQALPSPRRLPPSNWQSTRYTISEEINHECLSLDLWQGGELGATQKQACKQALLSQAACLPLIGSPRDCQKKSSRASTMNVFSWSLTRWS